MLIFEQEQLWPCIKNKSINMLETFSFTRKCGKRNRVNISGQKCCPSKYRRCCPTCWMFLAFLIFISIFCSLKLQHYKFMPCLLAHQLTFLAFIICDLWFKNAFLMVKMTDLQPAGKLLAVSNVITCVCGEYICQVKLSLPRAVWASLNIKVRVGNNIPIQFSMGGAWSELEGHWIYLDFL